MKTPRIFQPQDPEEVKAFMESIQGMAPPIHTQIINTGKQIAKAVGGTGVTIATSPLAVVEGGLYAAANVLAIPSVTANKIASLSNRARTRMYNAVVSPQLAA